MFATEWGHERSRRSAPQFDNDDEPTLSGRVTADDIPAAKARPRDRATLTLMSGPETGRVFSLGMTTTIGRSKDCTIRIDDGRSVRSAEPFVVMMDQYRAVIPTYGTPVDSPTTAELVWRAALPCMGHRFDIQVTWPANTPTIPLELMSMDIIASLVNEQGPVQP